TLGHRHLADEHLRPPAHQPPPPTPTTLETDCRRCRQNRWITRSTFIDEALAAFGYDAVSTDSAPGLCRWVDGAGRPVVRPDDPDLAWLATHQWVWDPARLDQVI